VRIAGAELHGGISLAGGAQAVEVRRAVQSDFIETDFAIEAERACKSSGFSVRRAWSLRARAEGIEIRGGDAQRGGHRVATVAQEQVIALAEGGSEIKAGNASARTAPFIASPR